jgi:spore germination cell wall hydrolase CwlJ-like protein
MIHLKFSAGLAAFAVALVSVLAPVEAPDAFAQSTAPVQAVEHTQPAAEEIVPQFVAKPVVQDIPEAPEMADSDPEHAGSLRELVARMPTDQPLDAEMKCLAQAIYFESRGEPLAGQLAVAEVIVNRAASGRFPASYCGVVTQRSQFSFVKRGRIPSVPEGSATYRRAKAIAQIAHRGLWDSKAEGALFFHARSVSPGWKGKHMAAGIGNHLFYK